LARTVLKLEWSTRTGCWTQVGLDLSPAHAPELIPR
jgi:hypothetical protein